MKRSSLLIAVVLVLSVAASHGAACCDRPASRAGLLTGHAAPGCSAPATEQKTETARGWLTSTASFPAANLGSWLAAWLFTNPVVATR